MAFKKPKPEGKKGLDEWMGTYGDMITLMLCFFVMLFAMSSLDEAKYTAVAESFVGRPVIISGGLGNIMSEGSGAGLLDQVAETEPSEGEDVLSKAAAEEMARRQQEVSNMSAEFKTYLSQNIATSKITVDVLGDYMRITFPDGMLFDSGKAELKPGAYEAINFVADELMKYPGHSIRVEGHTDTVPMHTAQYPSNRHLSSARADTVVEYLVNEKGFDPLSLKSEGMGEYWPVDTNETPEGRSNNRRVEIKVYASQTAGGLTIPMD